ncbi:hypothetical protein FDUTEX481_00855 [Tolypothrix sp. PCC 7601]|nr:hypothetical protein FDUTEX481_00855 [Tolypothrix sp. PCC 7601]
MGLGNSGPPLGIRGNGDWGLGMRGMREMREMRGEIPITHAQCPMPYALFPMPNFANFKYKIQRVYKLNYDTEDIQSLGLLA